MEYLACLIFSAILGIAITLYAGFVDYFDEYWTEALKKTLLIFVISTSILMSLLSFFTWSSHINDDEWNEGVCPRCNVEWRFVNKTGGGRYSTTSYVFQCDNCKKILTMYYNPTEQ